jgi:hypothetical protein
MAVSDITHINRMRDFYADDTLNRLFTAVIDRIEEISVKVTDERRIVMSKKFEVFWDLYDKKTGSRDNARKLFMKLSDRELQAVKTHLPGYLRDTPDKKFRKDPERYLRHKIYKTELLTENE